jgi:hypothetical protein
MMGTGFSTDVQAQDTGLLELLCNISRNFFSFQITVNNTEQTMAINEQKNTTRSSHKDVFYQQPFM